MLRHACRALPCCFRYVAICHADAARYFVYVDARRDKRAAGDADAASAMSAVDAVAALYAAPFAYCFMMPLLLP